MIIVAVLNALLLLFSLFVAGITAYLLVITVSAYFFRKKVDYRGKPLKLAVVIPAHNEEASMSATIEHVGRSSYDPSLYKTMVIADNCDDSTEEKALAAGASVFRRINAEERGKGQALDWFFTHHTEAYAWADGIVLIDADTIIDKGFLKEMAASLSHPAVKAVQGYYGVSNAHSHWRSGLVSAAFHVFNHLRPAGCNALGGTAGLRGNGMGFRKEVLLDLAWPAHSIVEDHEFTLRLLLKNIIVHYNPDAMVFSDMPLNSKVAERQRMRWEGMDRGMRNRFVRLVFRGFVSHPRVSHLHALFGFFVPPLSKVVMWQTVLFCGALFASPGTAVLLAACFGVDLFYVFSGLVLRGATSTEWLSLCRTPSYVLWKLGVYLKMIVKKPSVWERTKRPSDLGA